MAINDEYNKINGIVETDSTEIIPISPVPTEQDYRSGNMMRYFAQRKNSPEEIVEVGTGTTSGVLYKIESTFWKLTGPLEDSRDANDDVLGFGVLNTNMRMIAKLKLKIPGVDQILTDPLELTTHSPFTSDKVKKAFG